MKIDKILLQVTFFLFIIFIIVGLLTFGILFYINNNNNNNYNKYTYEDCDNFCNNINSTCFYFTQKTVTCNHPNHSLATTKVYYWKTGEEYKEIN